MVADRGRRRFIGTAGAAALASCLPAANVGASTPWQKEKGGGPQKNASLGRFGFVLHGGAGTIERGKMTPEREKAYRDKLTEALVAGFGVLKGGGQCLDAVVAAITLLEDSPLFNAGKGAVFTSAGTNELDSSIMDGKTLMAGSVAGLKRIKNPILLARLVMEQSPHVMLVGEGAEAFAVSKGVELVDPKYFYTEERWQQLQRQKEAERNPPPKKSRLEKEAQPFEDHKFGTVGAACLDQAGNLAAGTSTGGISNKRFGRVGDSPIIGAGTYANNETCAVSCTGDGEFFIRSVVAHDISALMQYGGRAIGAAAESVLAKVAKIGGTGGLIALDRRGNFAMPFNTSGMYRGWVGSDGQPHVLIYRD
ncbi:MAG: isoaspartyl peptidase/L-asparaginase [Acidobacteriota bacterium]|nr:isoaspartyl peptidase/L-asparaginase [Acidobacteriota bacterium]MDQ5838224.1 isoaspartyl peptidase/L-asparaginase [Acidobacteriota bacterium]